MVCHLRYCRKELNLPQKVFFYKPQSITKLPLKQLTVTSNSLHIKSLHFRFFSHGLVVNLVHKKK